PAVRRAVTVTRNGRVGVIGTRATIGSRAYEDAFAAAPQVSITTAACPQFVDFVERGITTGRALLGLASAYLEPLQQAGVDTLVLGCTHYPLLAGMIGLVMGEQVTLVSSADETARDLYRVLTEGDLARPADAPPPVHRFETTGDSTQFERLAHRAEAVGFRLLLAFGTGSLTALQRYGGLMSIDALLLTHLHGDHIYDACSYVVVRRSAPGAPFPPIPVYAPSGAPERLAVAY